jgi:hypothetical protein
MDQESATYEAQLKPLLESRRGYSVRVTPIPLGVWYLQAQTHKYKPYLRYWAMARFEDSRYPEGKSTWTLWFCFPEAPMEHLDKKFHEGIVFFLAEKEAPHHLMIPNLTLDLFVVKETIAKAQIL